MTTSQGDKPEVKKIFEAINAQVIKETKTRVIITKPAWELIKVILQKIEIKSL